MMYILRGLPASGKSTYRKSLGLPYVNKDEMRKQFPDMTERDIHTLTLERVRLLAASGEDFIIDNTNFNPRTVNQYIAIAREHNIHYEIIDFDLSVNECIYRDSLRPEKVGRDVILDMALRYGKHNHLGDIYIFDIDGTLADASHRIHYLQEKPKNWTAFFEAAKDDPVKWDIARLFRLVSEAGYTVLCVSGRPEREGTLDVRAQTRAWLAKYNLNPYALLMRRAHDRRDDDTVKEEIYLEKIKNNANVLGVFDDRLRVCRVWHKLGLTIFRVGDPDADF